MTSLTTQSTCSTLLLAHSTRFSTRSTHLSTRSTCLFIHSTPLFTHSTRLSTRSNCLSTVSICLSTRSTYSTICRSFYSWFFALLQQEQSQNLHVKQNNLSIHSIIIFTVHKYFFFSCEILKTHRIFFIKSKHLYLVKKIEQKWFYCSIQYWLVTLDKELKFVRIRR